MVISSWFLNLLPVPCKKSVTVKSNLSNSHSACLAGNPGNPKTAKYDNNEYEKSYNELLSNWFAKRIWILPGIWEAALWQYPGDCDFRGKLKALTLHPKSEALVSGGVAYPFVELAQMSPNINFLGGGRVHLVDGMTVVETSGKVTNSKIIRLMWSIPRRN